MAAVALIPQSVPALRAARSHYQKIVELIDKALEAAETFDPEANLTDPEEFADMEIAAALKKYLRRNDGRAQIGEALIALQNGGCNLGERPQANLSTAITRNASLFERRGDRVTLRTWRETAA